jgi:two-component system phosphate regulon sensor histidine kinase PhoR
VRGLLRSLPVVCAPAVAILVLLALLGRVTAFEAGAAVLAIVVASGALLLPHFRYLGAVRQMLRALARGEPAAAPAEPGPATAGLSAGLGHALANLQSQLEARRRALEDVSAGTLAVLDGLPDPLIVLDGNRAVTRANHAARTLFDGALAGQDLLGVIRDPALITAVDEALGGTPGRDVELVMPVPIERHFQARVEPLPGSPGGGAKAIISLHDLTQVRRLDQMRADFVANASHELRTPLSTLVGFIETLSGPARGDEAARDQFLAIMREQATRMARLIDDLLSLSRIELNEHTPPTGMAEIRHVLEAVKQSLEIYAAERDMRIELDIPELPQIPGNEDELTQVFQNLIDNALKYGQPRTTVRVTAGTGKRPGGGGQRTWMFVAVADQGDGIPAEDIPRITERFYRVDKARSRKLGGTGLGLAIVKHIVNRHRGRLEIASTLGVGSTFTVWLPTERIAGPEAPRT